MNRRDFVVLNRLYENLNLICSEGDYRENETRLTLTVDQGLELLANTSTLEEMLNTYGRELHVRQEAANGLQRKTKK